jgi:hypothetical protein
MNWFIRLLNDNLSTAAIWEGCEVGCCLFSDVLLVIALEKNLKLSVFCTLLKQ